MEDGYTGMKELLSRPCSFTAAFVESDMMAIAAIKALNDSGRSVPDDCSVIAIDGLDLSKYVTPTLTTMVQPCEEIGRESVRILLSMMEDSSVTEHIRPVAWQDTDSYAVTRLFLENREDLLRRMLGDGDAGL